MKFIEHIPKIGEKKTITKFLWFPVIINYIDHYEIRWLEKATIEYKFQRLDWIPYRFIDKEWYKWNTIAKQKS